jgi:hypothetical protein
MRPRRSSLGATGWSDPGERRGKHRTVHREQIQEKWMKLMKTSVIACALSALLVGPVLAQGASSDTKLRGGTQGKTMQGGASGGDDEELSAQPGAAGEKTGMKSTKGTKGAVGTTGSATHKGTADDAASGGTSKRY